MDNKVTRALFIPVIGLLGIVPLIVRLNIGILNGKEAVIFQKSNYIEFYSQSKAVALILTAALMVVVAVIFHKRITFKKSKAMVIYMGAMGLFVILTGISTALSEYKSIALWGAYDRAEGLYTWVSYIIICFYTAFIWQNIKDIKYIVYGLTIVVVMSTIIGISQYIGYDLLLSDIGKMILIPDAFADLRKKLVSQFSGGMMTGTMYNPNYVGSFAAMTFPFFTVLLILIKEYKKKILLSLLAICSLILLVGSGSSAGILGTGAALVLAVIIFRTQLVNLVKKHTVKLYIVMGILIVLAALTNQFWFSEVKSIAVGAKNLLISKDKSYDFREELPVKDIYKKDDRTVVVTQKDDIQIAYKNSTFEFYDKQNNRIDYLIKGERYITANERFKDYFFKIMSDKNDKNRQMVLGLVHVKKVGGKDKETLLFFFKIFPQEGVRLINSITEEEAELAHPKTMGFRGKERLASGRGFIWSRTIPMIGDTKLLGYGPDVFPLKFPQDDRLGKLYSLGSTEIIVDKPHDLYLQIAINSGIIGLLCFFIFIGTYVLHSLRIYTSKRVYNDEDAAGIAILLAVIGYLVAGVFNDSTVSVAPIFWILVGSGMAINYLETNQILTQTNEIEEDKVSI